MNEYEKQAEDFLKKTKTKIKIEYSHTDKHFEGDVDIRDIYNVTLTRGSRIYKFTFGNSINNSGQYKLHGKIVTKKEIIDYNKKYMMDSQARAQTKPYLNKDFKTPTSYDILSCLTKNDVGTFKEFCSDFGYNETVNEFKIYKKVVKEYRNLQRLFNDSEMELLSEIE